MKAPQWNEVDFQVKQARQGSEEQRDCSFNKTHKANTSPLTGSYPPITLVKMILGSMSIGLVLGISWPRSSIFNSTNQVPELLFNSLVYRKIRYHGYTGTNRSQCRGLDEYGSGISARLIHVSPTFLYYYVQRHGCSSNNKNE